MRKPAKILINTYDTAFQNKAGGVHNRIAQTVDAIRKEGIMIDYFNKYTTVIDDYDVLHVFMLNVESYGLIKLAKSKGKRVVLSSIVTLGSELQLRLYWTMKNLPIMTTYKILFNICNLVDAIIAETPQEAKFIQKYYHVNADKIHIVPNGVDIIQSDSKIIYDVIGKKCEYALEVGRFDKNKNQLSVINALKNTDIDVVFIGGESPVEKEYYNQCVASASGASNVHFLGWLDSQDELIKSAYVNAKVLISSSFKETFGLSIIEGAIAGNIPVISQTLPILDYDVFKNCIKFNPANETDIREKISIAMKRTKTEILKIEVEKFFSWHEVAKKHIDIYTNM